MRLITPQQATFADSFAHWGLTMPDEAVARRGDGHLNGAGWSVRFVWRDDGTLLFRAGHRMTNERMPGVELVPCTNRGRLPPSQAAGPRSYGLARSIPNEPILSDLDGRIEA